MKNSIKKNSLIVLMLALVSVSLIGCGTDKDSGGMGKPGSSASTLKL